MPTLSDVASPSERDSWLELNQVQHMVRVTCLEVMGAAPTQIEAYRNEVLELQRMIAAWREEKGREPPSSPGTASTQSADRAGLGSPDMREHDESTKVALRAAFTAHPERAWFEGRNLPRFAVSLAHPSGEAWSDEDGPVTLRVSLRNGRGHLEELLANGSGRLVGGERCAPVCAGEAAWEQLRICEASSKHYRAFTLCVSASACPDGYRVDELRSEPITVQVARMQAMPTRRRWRPDICREQLDPPRELRGRLAFGLAGGAHVGQAAQVGVRARSRGWYRADPGRRAGVRRPAPAAGSFPIAPPPPLARPRHEMNILNGGV